MTDHEIVSREEWAAARAELLAGASCSGSASKGRDEGDASQVWIRRHDEY